MSVSVSFVVSSDTAANESVFVVGNDAILGFWNPLKATQLRQDASKNWTCRLSLAANASYSYRFFVGKMHPTKPASKGLAEVSSLDIVKWETHKTPRQFTTGQEKALSLPVTAFGRVDGVDCEGKGWLINWFEVQIRLHSNPIQFFLPRSSAVGHVTGPSVMCIPVQRNQGGRTVAPYGDVLVSSRGVPIPQGRQGVPVADTDFVVFRHRTPDLQRLSVQLDVLTLDATQGALSVLGSAHLLPSQFPDSQHTLQLPVISREGKPIGEIKVDILVARPTPGMTFDMESCDKGYPTWRKECGKKTLDIGHRGMGSSYSVANPHKENTVSSFKTAARYGADFIETDILLSKDRLPVVFHDFGVTAAIRNKQEFTSDSSELHTIPVQDLSLHELLFKRFYTSKGQAINDEVEQEVIGGGEKGVLFPTLMEILTEVDESLGYDLEIKYPQMKADDEMEADHYPDKNAFLDVILHTVYQHANQRRIIFTTFEPDMCALLQLKQSRYPVMFLSQGPTDMYMHYSDVRSVTFSAAINFALSEQILGLVLHAEVLLRDMAVIESVLNQHLVLFVWGEHINDTDLIRQMRQRGVDGCIYDRMDLNKPELVDHALTMLDSNGLAVKRTKKDCDCS